MTRIIAIGILLVALGGCTRADWASWAGPRQTKVHVSMSVPGLFWGAAPHFKRPNEAVGFRGLLDRCLGASKTVVSRYICLSFLLTFFVIWFASTATGRDAQGTVWRI